MKKIAVVMLAVVLAGLLSACGGSNETPVTGEAKEAVLAYSEAKTENLLSGMNAGDYAAFSKDFDQDMLNAMTEEEFTKLKKDRDNTLGQYVSRQVKDVMQSPSGDFIAVVYDAAFEKEEAVTMRVVFRAEEPNQISGLWFNK